MPEWSNTFGPDCGLCHLSKQQEQQVKAQGSLILKKFKSENRSNSTKLQSLLLKPLSYKKYHHHNQNLNKKKNSNLPHNFSIPDLQPIG